MECALAHTLEHTTQRHRLTFNEKSSEKKVKEYKEGI